MRRRTVERLALLGVVILVVGLGAGIYLALRPLPVSGPRPAPGPSIPSAPGEDRPTNLASLWEGFDSAKEPATQTTHAAPSSSLPFTLKGTIFVENGDSVAFVEVNKAIVILHIGESVEGYTLKAVANGSATFTRDGEETTVAMAGQKYAPADLPMKAAPAANTSATAAIGLGKRPVPNLASVRRTASSVSSAPPRKDLDPAVKAEADATVGIPAEVAELARTNPQAAREGVTMKPIIGSGGMQGIQIASVSAGSLAARYGLAPGDRILAVNGQSLNSIPRIYELYDNLREGNSVNITLEREGTRRNVIFYVR